MHKVFRFGQLCLGAAISGCGIAIAMNTGLGADPITVFFEGMSKTFHVSVGMASNITILSMAALAWLLDRKQVGLGTLVSPFFVAWGIDVMMPLFPRVVAFPYNYLVMFFGLLVCAFGIAMCIASYMGHQGTDALILALSHRFKQPYYRVRWVTDGTLLVLGILLGGRFNAATIIATLSLGKLISLMYTYVFYRHSKI